MDTIQWKYYQNMTQERNNQIKFYINKKERSFNEEKRKILSGKQLFVFEHLTHKKFSSLK